MKQFSFLGFAVFILLTCNNVFAQSNGPLRSSVRLTKVNQIGHNVSGSARGFTLKGERVVEGILNIYTLTGHSNVGVSEDCLELASTQNANSLGAPSNIIVHFTFVAATGGGVGGGPLYYNYTNVVITSCALTTS